MDVLQAASLVGPAVYSFLLYDGTKANINTYVRVITFGFTWGYLITFALELVVVRGRFLLCGRCAPRFLEAAHLRSSVCIVPLLSPET